MGAIVWVYLRRDVGMLKAGRRSWFLPAVVALTVVATGGTLSGAPRAMILRSLCKEVNTSASRRHFLLLDPADCTTCDPIRKQLIAQHVRDPGLMAIVLTRAPTAFERKQLALSHVRPVAVLAVIAQPLFHADSAVSCDAD